MQSLKRPWSWGTTLGLSYAVTYVRERAARDWCAWEDTHVATYPGRQPYPRFVDPVFRMAFARLVTHYWRHAAWLEDGALMDGARIKFPW
jgi:hypothetical protein